MTSYFESISLRLQTLATETQVLLDIQEYR